MKKASLFTTLAFGCVTVLGTATFASAAEQTFINIGTGGVTGVYYPAGNAIARLVNKGTKDHGVRANVEATGGSIYNLNALAVDELDIGITQSDWQYHAYNGTSQFEEKGPNKDLRALFAIHQELFTVVARKDANIKNFTDLEGKRFNIGDPGSGQKVTAMVLLDAMGWDESKFKLVSQLKPAEQAQALCDNKVDAIVYAVGHPNGSIKEATTACDANVVTVDGPAVDKLISENSYYSVGAVPAGMYRGNDADTNTFGMGATFVSSTAVPEEVVYTVVKAVFENFDDFKKLHPAFSNLEKEKMIKEGLSAPLHDGAIKYYKEVGLM